MPVFLFIKGGELEGKAEDQIKPNDKKNDKTKTKTNAPLPPEPLENFCRRGEHAHTFTCNLISLEASPHHHCTPVFSSHD